MTYICSAGAGIPPYEITQQEIKLLVSDIFTYTKKELTRLMPVFDHAKVNKRQFVVDKQWFKESHTFEEKNNLYQKYACEYSLKAIDECLTNGEFLKEDIPYEAVDMIIYISSTGIATPSIDAYILNERSFRENVSRMPLWGLGCAGGAIGLSRAFDWISSNPDKTALVVCCELCGLTFQKSDNKKSNVVGTALFGDGVAAVLICGQDSPYCTYRKKVLPKIMKTSSFTKKDSLSIMGWDVTNNGLEVIFSKSIPALVHTLWRDHIQSFFHEIYVNEVGIHSFIAHPGGQKVLEAMKDVLQLSSQKKLAKSYEVLENHGNMSSATVIYVLKEWMKETVEEKELSIVSALGPGFSSELLLLEWNR
ncbi:type III polyketide synthase [Virgibacillus oceani]|uniref:Chalcone synthase n=1 Tax=Virgibacillus oceani TaxID=1479511 RepID=A0A917LZD2_9BACI|nr:3-oxoacyl-[acyl-carrier-protein] synthase III C-terminal domain-containing protein [Virgibacillus oceani]GGG65617.1 putative chalcone synthase [Virgibacillus oceani]